MLKLSTFLLVTAAIGGVLWVCLASAQTPEPLGDDYSLTEGFLDLEPDIAMDARGNFVVVWERGWYGYRYFDWDVWRGVFDSTGNRRSEDLRVNWDRAGNSLSPRVGVAPDGKFIVVWHKTPSRRPETHIVARRFDSTGSPLGDDFLVGAASRGYDLARANLDVNPEGDFVVAWQRQRKERSTIQVRRFAADGTDLGAELRIAAAAGELARFPDVRWTPDGGFIVVWVTNEGGSWQRYSADGTAIGSPFAFHTTYERGGLNGLDIAPSGELVITWVESTDDATHVFARRFASDATPLSDRFQVNTSTTGHNERPSVAMERGGEFIIVWESPVLTRFDLKGDSIQAQRFSSTGERVGEEFQVSTITEYSQRRPAVAAGSGKGFVVVWDNWDYLPYLAHVGGRRFGPTPPFCTETEIAACLNRGRFRVEVEWKDFSGKSGTGRRVPQGSEDSALFWFFGPDNWEVLVKVLDGCAINHRFWVFAATTTNVAYVLRITDTETGQVREYENPLGKAADAVTDTEAFATC